MKLEVFDHSTNYTCQVIKLPNKVPVQGLDNLVKVSVQGNECLIGKDSNPDELYLFFPAESQICHDFISKNNLYRDPELNRIKTEKGFFENNRRVKAIKFKGVISSGFVIPLTALKPFLEVNGFKVGDEFNAINGNELCRKFVKKIPKERGEPKSRDKYNTISDVVDGKMAPQHPDTEQFMKNIHKFALDTQVAITYKLHGTSARYYNTIVKRALTWKDKVAKWFGVKVQENEYNYICASRRVIKSVSFEELPEKNHWYTEDLWTKVGKEYFDGKLLPGESVYCEIIGKDYTGAAIQHGYTYGFDKPMVYIYRIANINSKGVEVDLSYAQMKIRAQELGLPTCPEFFVGTIQGFISKVLGNGSVFHTFDTRVPDTVVGTLGGKNYTLPEILDEIFYQRLLEKPSIMDNSVVEEGFCVRIDSYPKAETFKVKSRKFLLHESSLKDKDVVDVEEQEAIAE